MSVPLIPVSYIREFGDCCWRIPLDAHGHYLHVQHMSNGQWLEVKDGRIHTKDFSCWMDALRHYDEQYGVILYPPGCKPSPEGGGFLSPGEPKHGKLTQHDPLDLDRMSEIEARHER
jgi:hypothetical protein